MSELQAPRYTMGEEIFNAVTHGVGACLSLVFYGYMLALSVHFGDVWCVASVTIYCFTLFAMFISSACYHALPYPTAKRVMRVLDHCAIYLLIAGTYTPYTLINLRGPLGWTIFAVIWAMAILGIILNAIDLKRFAKVSVACYVLMGWAVVFALKPLLATLALSGIVTLAVGGLFYTVGVAFYVIKKIKYFHSIWHLFVLAGAITHFYSILLYVLPAGFAAA